MMKSEAEVAEGMVMGAARKAYKLLATFAGEGIHITGPTIEGAQDGRRVAFHAHKEGPWGTVAISISFDPEACLKFWGPKGSKGSGEQFTQGLCRTLETSLNYNIDHGRCEYEGHVEAKYVPGYGNVCQRCGVVLDTFDSLEEKDASS